MSYDSRLEYAKHVSEQLLYRLYKLMPEGIWHWPQALEIVKAEDAAFNAAAAEFVVSGEEADKKAMIERGVELRDAWLRAAKAFEAAN